MEKVYQSGSVRRVKRAKGRDVWIWRYRICGAMRQQTLSAADHSRQRFDSGTEHRFALILDRDSFPWLKPSPGDLDIYYCHEDKCVPDFVAETAATKYLCETNATNEMKDETVKKKAKAASAWRALISVPELPSRPIRPLLPQMPL